MAVLICQKCGEQVTARTRFEAEGECPECGADAGALVEEDSYDPEPRYLYCERCSFADDSAVERDDGARLTIDDDCPDCGAPLVPADGVRTIRDRAEVKLARSAAAKLVVDRRLTAPIDVERVAESLGLEIVVDRFDHDGMLVGSVIQVPSDVAPVVQRFVIAHETGHHELRHRGDRSKIEPEANAFASELLLPAAQLRTFVGRGATIRDVAGTFQVSQQAATYALMTHGLMGRVTR